MQRSQSARLRLGATGVLCGLLALLAPSVVSAAELPLRMIDVVEVSWQGAPALKTTTGDVVSMIRNDTIERWKRISGGRVVFTFDQVMPRVQTSTPLPCDAPGSAAFLNAVALKAYEGAGVTDFNNRYLIVLSPDPGTCLWDGRGVINAAGSASGLLILKDTADAMVIAHELGHNLGLGHSNLERCRTGRPDGAWKDCTAVEYGSATDVMSNSIRDSPLAAYHQWRLGWIPDSDVALGNRSISVALRSVDADTGTRAVFVRDQSAAYWVEFRHADPANGIHQGLVIYRTDQPPASSIENPVGTGETDSASNGLTRDVWMINLGDYVHGSGGSPSLAPDVAFTTAYGGATIVAHLNADTTAAVSVTRSGNAAPAAPVWTDPATWRNASAPVIATDLDDRGMDIVRFEARIAVDSQTRLIAIPRTLIPPSQRTYLNPISDPVVVVAGSLPEGQYSIRLRAINALGKVGAWSALRTVHIDRGRPVVTPRFVSTAVDPGHSVAVEWRGSVDAGSGICSAQVLNPDGFALYGWRSEAAGTPRFRIPASGRVSASAQVFDCLGNGVQGDLRLDTAYLPASAFVRTGSWSSTGSAATCWRGECSASLVTGPGVTALVFGAGAATVLVDGKRAAAVKPASSTGARLYTVSGAHRIRIQGRGFVLHGAQRVRATWTATAALTGAIHDADASLSDPTQRALARIGFSQADFSDTQTVRLLGAGNTTKDATLDLCESDFPSESARIARRQVIVTKSTVDSYTFLSTETVRYASAAAVREALQEIDAASTLCRTRGYSLSTSGVKTPYAFSALPALPSGLRPEADRRLYLVTTGESTTAMTILIAYQFKGDTLNALYVAKRGAASLDDATVSRWLDVAVVLAGRLDRLVT